MIRRDLARALARADVADWVIVERTADIATEDASRRDRQTRRRERRVDTSLVVHVGDSRGRGSARVEIASQDTDAEAIVDHVVALALAAIGPEWKSPPAAAPARVRLLDPALGRRDAADVAAHVARTLRAPAPLAVTGSTRMTREQTVVESRSGLTTRWEASVFEVAALVDDGHHSLALHRHARREEDLALPAAITDATDDLALLATARPIAPGPCALVLDTDACLHDGDHGVWAVFATQADAVLERQGLTRYRRGVPVAPGADHVDEPLTITSNGALDYAVRSAPVGDDGGAVRRFQLVERGVAKDLALSPREAALRHLDPNGGVRNLVVSPGTWDGKPPTGGATRALEVRRLRAISIDPYTGDASLELALALEHAGGRTQPVTGGTVRLDLITALAHARRSATTIRRGAYQGPTRLLIERAEVV